MPLDNLSDFFSVLQPSAEAPRGAAWARENQPEIARRLREDGPPTWYNKIEVIRGSGVFTSPNAIDATADQFFATFGIDASELAGKRVLDIGAFSGSMTFFAEDCGATVTAIDIQEPGTNGFAVLHELRRSRATHVVASVYDLHPDLFGTFDIVVFSGVHYHLKHPLLALERINGVMPDNGLLLTMGTSGDFWLHEPRSTLDGVDLSSVSGPNLSGSLNSIPLLGFYADAYRDDASNWFVPNTRALTDMIVASGFEVSASAAFPTVLPTFEQRIGVAVIAASKVANPEPEYSPDVYAHIRRLDAGEAITTAFSIPTWYELEKARRAGERFARGAQ